VRARPAPNLRHHRAGPRPHSPAPRAGWHPVPVSTLEARASAPAPECPLPGVLGGAVSRPSFYNRRDPRICSPGGGSTHPACRQRRTAADPSGPIRIMAGVEHGRGRGRADDGTGRSAVPQRWAGWCVAVARASCPASSRARSVRGSRRSDLTALLDSRLGGHRCCTRPASAPVAASNGHRLQCSTDLPGSWNMAAEYARR
jgi:hypothetical protein